jgi:hypothetical protein
MRIIISNILGAKYEEKIRLTTTTCIGLRRFGVWNMDDAQGGMRFAFPPYGPFPLYSATALLSFLVLFLEERRKKPAGPVTDPAACGRSHLEAIQSCSRCSIAGMDKPPGPTMNSVPAMVSWTGS